MGYYQGDPAWGLLAGVAAKFAPKLASKIPGVGKVIGRLGGRAGAAIGGLLGGRAGRVIKTGGKIAAGGAVFEVGSRAARRVFDGEERRRYRRMNVTNVKALRRAIRRAKGFSKLARSVLTFTSPRAPKGKVTFKTGRRR